MPYYPLRKQSDIRVRRHDLESYRVLSTPETMGSCGESEVLPSFEIQTSSSVSSHEFCIREKDGTSQEIVVLISETGELIPHSQSCGNLSRQGSCRAASAIVDAAVASVWVQMGQNTNRSESSTSPSPTEISIQRQSPTAMLSRQQPSSHKTQSIFRRTSQWWRDPSVSSNAEEESVTMLPTKTCSLWLRKSRRATDQSRNRSRFRTTQEVHLQSRPKQVICATESLASPPITYRHSGRNLKQGVTPLRVKQTTTLTSASLIDSPLVSGLSVSSSNKPRNQQQNEASKWRNIRTSNTVTMTGASSKWKTAVDPKSGKTYYYHVETRETQWRKPIELASEAEKQAMLEKERKQRDFFAAMEANILRNLQAGIFSCPSPPMKHTMSKNESNLADEGVSLSHGNIDDEISRLREKGAVSRPDLVRTISSMDERILKDLVISIPSHRSLSVGGVMHSPTDVTTTASLYDTGDQAQSDGGLKDVELTTIMQTSLQQPPVARPLALRGSAARQPSLGTVLASLPEENEPSMESFGDLSMHNMGLSEQESQALINFAQVSSQMSLLGEEVFAVQFDRSLAGLALEEEYDQEDNDNGELCSLTTDQVEAEEDPLRNMDFGPDKRNIARSVGSHRLLAGETEQKVRPTKISRRNTCGTLYVGSTLSQPDVDATIKCVCGVIRAHIIQSEMADSRLSEYEIFNDQESQQVKGSSSQFSISVNERPGLNEISAFYRDVFQRAQMESDCIIMSLIYVERLIKSTKGRLRPNVNNWRSVLFSCMVLASKVWDDLSMWNGDFSQTCPTGVKFSLKRINQLELAVLAALSYKVKVPASEYAKYYFLLRAMLIKSGLGGESLKELNPLDVEGARRLQQVSSRYQRAAYLRQVGNTAERRSKSLTIGRISEDQRDGASIERKGKISLEHMVQM